MATSIGADCSSTLLYHKIAIGTLVLTALHGLAYMLAHDNSEEDATVVLFLFSLGPIRRKFFEFFVRVHWVLFIVAISSTGLIWNWLGIYARGSLLNGKKTADNSTTNSPANFVTGKRLGVIARGQLSVSLCVVLGRHWRHAHAFDRQLAAHDVNTQGRPGIERVHFVWSVRDRDTIEAMIGNKVLKPGSSSYFPSRTTSSRPMRDLEGSWADQQLESCLRYNCRPDVAATLRSLGEQDKQSGKQRVAVLVCGPYAMVRDVIATSMALGREMNVHFDVHSELFEFKGSFERALSRADNVLV
ncbi:hypothetical protein PHYSODRAFT_343049 [Phytophthora sojae]|uniref:Ferric reductase NAD binding domain-containing protein n=1 Tax=Phytophthora sojae (strain P6497) TaxID=1094619 RepID=G5AIG0_PHYSP|nr:hypothetical protein PHYSODRAFT_343049 [Phytophthora sojae]EGZ04661.1 hypothetical protein PHYSODRAFT_343049 [Phytophthora sojae]|eukprot:XP_009539861.1 hypothetical protein PHYSODRAFT_343049 [Phytophthora sojae]